MVLLPSYLLALLTNSVAVHIDFRRPGLRGRGLGSDTVGCMNSWEICTPIASASRLSIATVGLR